MPNPLTSSGTPAAELAIDADLARRLLANQHPDLTRLPITPVASGWDNVIFRLGDELALRLPRRARGWAVLFAVLLLNAGLADDPRMATIAATTLQRLVAGP